MPFTDSTSATGGVDFLGVWIHDPLDPEGTIRQFLFGSANRSAAAAVEHVGTFYAGRTHPVFDYGEQITETFDVKIDVPFSDTWADDMVALRGFALQARNVVVRDSRGRSFTGAMAGYSEPDQDWGTQVTFQVTRAHEETVTV